MAAASRSASSPHTKVVPALMASAVIGAFQLLVTWFILGNSEVLLKQLPLTIAALATAEAFSLLRVGGDGMASITGLRVAASITALGIVLFAFVAAIATSRGQDPIGQPPKLTEWAIALACVLLVSGADRYLSRRRHG